MLGFVFVAVCVALRHLLLERPILCMTVMLVGAINLYVALANIIPMKTAMINNDGMNAITLRHSPAAIESFRIQLLMNAESSRGVSVTDMPAEWFELTDDADLLDTMVAARAYLRFVRLFTDGKFTEARRLGEHLLENAALVGVYRAQLINDIGYIAAINGDKETAHRIFRRERTKYHSLFRMNLAGARSSYAYQRLILGSEAGARNYRRHLDTLLTKLGNYAFKQDIDLEMALIETVDKIYDRMAEQRPEK